MHEAALKFAILFLMAWPLGAFADGARTAGTDLVLAAAVVTAAGIVWRRFVRPLLDMAEHLSLLPKIAKRVERIEKKLGLGPLDDE